MDLERFFDNLASLQTNTKWVLQLAEERKSDSWYYSYYREKLAKEKQGLEEQPRLLEILEDLLQAISQTNHENIIHKGKALLEMVEETREKLRPYLYKTFRVGSEFYKAKALFFDEKDDGLTLRYGIFSFLSKQELKAFMSNLQKGLKNSLGYDDIASIKNGYVGVEARTTDENLGDGVHAVIWNDSDRVLRVHRGENKVEAVFNWLQSNLQTGLIPEWRQWLYNKLSDKGLVRECKGFDYTGKAPKVIVIDEAVDTELVRNLKSEGLKSGEIKLPVEENVSLDQNMSFLDLIKEFVLPTLESEKAHYNVGDPINPIFQSPIRMEGGKLTKLFPRQQIIGQGIVNAAKAGKFSIFLNGGTGIGKTFTSIKTSIALLEEVFKKKEGRIIVYAQGHLIPKWKRQIKQALTPMGIKPKFYEILSFKDVKDLPKKPQGVEFFLMPKDRVKRNYQIRFTANERFNRKNLKKIADFIESVEVDEKSAVISKIVDIPINLMKVAARRLDKKYKKPVVLLKEQYNHKGEVMGYKGVTTSDKLLEQLGGRLNKAYDFYISLDELDKIQNAADLMVKHYQPPIRRSSFFHNGLTCPECGGFLYTKGEYLFDDVKYLENLHKRPGTKSTKNARCRSFVKADGTPLTQWEVQEIRAGNIDLLFTENKNKNASPYVDLDGNPLEGEDLRKAKAGKYEGVYKIVLTECGSILWSAFEQKGYRTVNAADVLLKKFGKNSFDVLIADECHIYSRESAQGVTFGVLCQLSKIKLGLTATMTGGKASDLYYMFWRMMPGRMVELGYRYEDVNLFIDHFGRRKKVTKEYISNDQYNKSGKGKKTSTGWNEIPGISPLLYTYFLADTMVSRKLEDMNIPMPPLRYYKHEIEMTPDLKKNYEQLKRQMVQFMREHPDKNLGGSYLHALLSYPDMPDQEPIYYKGVLEVARPPKIDISNRLLPKEKKLLETIRKERKEGRRVAVYVTYTGDKGVNKRIIDIISRAGFKVAELKASVPLEKRESWIDEQVRKGVEVMVLNPALVQTGLDIIAFPTCYFFEEHYDVKLIRQAEKRAWRPNQDKECRIYYSYYKDSLQEDAIKLIGSKKKASLALEGVFSEDMLSSMGDAGDESGAALLFKALQGKITLKEEDLDAFGFEEEPEEPVIFETAEKTAENENETAVTGQLDIFSFSVIEEDEVKEMRKRVKGKAKRNIIEGQLLFGM
ncbi:MAG: hypothetical protein H0Z24_08705 [Thermosipho sp. (in: Bacteria)]|nr:hypothetical protein [Thermosipho sp. (in: thermotogales)]